MNHEKNLHPSFRCTRYLFRRKFFKLFGGAFHVYDGEGNPVLYSRQKAFRLREDFRVYADEARSEELLVVKTPDIFDVWATYGVWDSAAEEPVGAIRRKALASVIRDEWTFLSPGGEEIGTLKESSIVGALASRFVNIIPQTYAVTALDGSHAADIRQHFNPFVLKYTMTIPDPDPPIDRRLLVAAGILLAGVERRQE